MVLCPVTLCLGEVLGSTLSVLTYTMYGSHVIQTPKCALRLYIVVLCSIDACGAITWEEQYLVHPSHSVEHF